MHNWYPGGGEGYSNIFIYMYTKARPILGDLKFWISIFIYYYYYYYYYYFIYFFWGGGRLGVGGSENWIIMENADFVDTFWGVITKQTIFWVHFYAFTGLF